MSKTAPGGYTSRGSLFAGSGFWADRVAMPVGISDVTCAVRPPPPPPLPFLLHVLSLSNAAAAPPHRASSLPYHPAPPQAPVPTNGLVFIFGGNTGATDGSGNNVVLNTVLLHDTVLHLYYAMPPLQVNRSRVQARGLP